MARHKRRHKQKSAIVKRPNISAGAIDAPAVYSPYSCIFTDAVICEDTDACEMWHRCKKEETVGKDVSAG